LTIKFDCPCGKTLRVPASAAGRMARCPSCGATSEVPLLAVILDETEETQGDEEREGPRESRESRVPRLGAASLPDTDVGRQRVLVVDDDHDLVQSLIDRLHGQDVTVLSAYTGDEGLALARDRRPDVILLDVALPKTNGFDLYEKIRGNGQSGDALSPDSAIILLAPRTRDEDYERGQRLGVEACLRKPVQMRELCEQIRALLAAKRR